MVVGIETFREKFREYTDCYTVIGGAACDILMSNADMEFRATKDIDDETSSLSAILLNEDFYKLMMQGRTVMDGISVLAPEYLIPFKMFAWLDLKARKKKGEHVNERDLKKHKYDVFRLLQIVSIDAVIETDGLVHDSIVAFCDSIMEERLPLDQIGISLTKDEGIHILKKLYGVE